MATEFKRKTMGDVPTTTLPNTTNANSDLYTVPANCDSVIIGLLLTNISAGVIVVDALIEVQSGQGEDVFIVKNANIPYGSALEIISGKVIVANTGSGTGDTIQVRCHTGATHLDAVISVLENT
tara:strand:+ start:785 stop:1156 length:372 start_codon:yes stop_codon:yes gene_type:complete